MIAGMLAACGRAPERAGKEVTVWRPLGAWTGRTVLQTDSFISNTGLLRLTWEARNAASPQVGTLRISLHSDVSGRRLAVVVDHRGAGRDVTYINEDPRAFFLVIESDNLEWSVEVAEGIAGTRSGP